MSSNGNDCLTTSSNDIDPVSKYFIYNKDENFKKELRKLLEEGLKEGTVENSGKLYSIKLLN